MTGFSTEALLTVKEAAARLNVSEKKIRRLIIDSELATVRIGRAVRIHPKELLRFISMNWDQGPPSPSKIN